MLNGCRYCIDDAAGVALEEGVSPAELQALLDLSKDVLGPRRVAQLTYARSVVLTPTSVSDDVVDELRRYVDDEEFLELTAIVAMKCFWNHFMTSLRVPPEGRCADIQLFQLLCEMSEQMRDNIQRHLPR
jgi:alkylhydroperoxidase family enzyme